MQVDLTNCDREPIHLLGNVQPFGCLIGVSREWVIEHVSENARGYLGRAAAELLGHPLSDVFTPEAIHAIRGRMQVLASADSVERIFRLDVQGSGKPFDVAVHVSAQAIIIEIEPSAPDSRAQSIPVVRSLLSHLQAAETFDKFCRAAVRYIRATIEFDRVMLYRFDPDGAGEVIAESARPDLVKYLGHHYPASDIPRQARLLYQRNWLRIIPDLVATPSPILSVPEFGDQPLDLSMSMLRSVSPIHIEYLQNMGVFASLSVSVLTQGKLWGLFACHHYSPRHVGYERRSAAELFGQIFSLMLESRERARENEYEQAARERHNQIVSRMADGTSAFHHLADHLGELSEAVESDGVALYLDGVLTTRGATPSREEILGVVNYLNRRGDGKIFATDEIGRDYPPGRDFVERAGGMLSIPLSAAGPDCMLFFRKEQARTVTWGGDPTKPAVLGPNGIRLTPRKSFEAWQEVVKGRSRQWTDLDLRLAESLRVTLLEVVLRLTDVAVKERKAAQERQELLIAELNHRVRNILALIRGLITQSKDRAMSLEEFASVIGGRVQALARAHDQITVDNWGPAPLRTLFAAETQAYLTGKSDRIMLEGQDVLLDPRAFSTLALVVHELLTNSAKYGALCDSVGKVKVKWSMENSGRLAIDWSEEGGPPVQAPTRRGFGSTIIERSIPFDLKGEAEVSYNIGGLRAHFEIPSNYVHRSTVDGAPQIEDGLVGKTVDGAAALQNELRIEGAALVVEDNMIIALDAEMTLTQLGAHPVETAPNVAEALRLIDAQAPALAVVDVNLGQESSFPVADILMARNIPFVFATGYGKNTDFPQRFRNVPVVTKPYAAQSFRAKIAEALGSDAKV